VSYRPFSGCAAVASGTPFGPLIAPEQRNPVAAAVTPTLHESGIHPGRNVDLLPRGLLAALRFHVFHCAPSLDILPGAAIGAR
jgi:hypothetical protein